MTWFGWVIVADLALGALIVIARGERPKARTPLDIVCAVIEMAALIVGVLYVGTGSL